ncbi:MAG: protein translocase subunit SecD [Opitutales bacterium]|nr:protein translocase subunit SecD [Opitutales bacterium]
MNRSIAWKLIITVAVVVWAAFAMIPLKDTPFDEYIRGAATSDKAEFAQVIEKAQACVDPVNYKTQKDKYPTLYIALREYSNKNEVDLAKYFPDINVRDIKILKKRNTILLKELYKRSKSALKQGLDLQGGVSFTLQIDENELSGEQAIKENQIEDVIAVINNRVNGLGVTEPTIRAVGGSSIEVQMPGVSLKDNPEAIEELSRPAKLEFRLVHRTIRPSSAKPPKSEIPVGYELMLSENERGNTVVEVPYYVKKRPEATGEIIKKAGVAIQGINQFLVTMDFTDEGSKVIQKITSTILEEDKKTGIKQPMAIVLDGKLMSAPNIQGVLEKSGQITGNFTHREAVELANALNNPLSVGLKRTSLNEVGPSLAEDAKDASLFAAFMACVTVVVFMLACYLNFGAVAIVTIFVNLFLVVGVLASFGSTMTLPGIAALALTAGMAIDANILIFERIREELKLGKNLLSALESGYSMAFSTIVDANLTTLITALILWYFGSGPVKGFGVTLAVGILTTMFCALILCRALLEILVRTGIFKNGFKFSIMKEDTKFKFLNYAKLSCSGALILFIAFIAFIAYQGDKCVGIDFTGGEVISAQYKEKLPINSILGISSENHDLGEIQAAYQKDIATGGEYLSLQTEADKGDAVLAALEKKYPQAGLKFMSKQSIGSAVSDSIVKDALIACFWSMIAIMLYVAFRFEWGYGIGALVSTLHDVVITIGIYVFIGKVFGIGTGQFSAPMVAAILMIVGYSINDTIVVFDRIREELQLKPDMSLRDIIHYATNRTLSRTMLTSVSTLLAALALFFFGAEIIRDFSLVFIIGIIVGTFSSLFIATPVFYWWHGGSRKRVEAKEPAATKYSWES